MSKVRLEQDRLGALDFTAMHAVRESKLNDPQSLGTFGDEDFSNEGCGEIPSVVIEEAKHFVTFMSSMVEELLGNENFVANILKIAKLEEAAALESASEPEEEEDDYKKYKEYMERRQAYESKQRNIEHQAQRPLRRGRPSQ